MVRRGRGALKAVVAVAIMLSGLVGMRSSEAATGDPTGAFYGVDRPNTRQVNVSGWASDPDQPSTALWVQVLSGGPNGTVKATVRADIDPGSFGGSAPRGHTFNANVNITTAAQQICIRALNVGSAGQNASLGCKSLAALSLPPKPGTPGNPYGQVLGARRLATGQIQVDGWAIDPDDLNKPIYVNLYFDGVFYVRAYADIKKPSMSNEPGPYHRFSILASRPPGNPVAAVMAENIGIGGPTWIGSVRTR